MFRFRLTKISRQAFTLVELSLVLVVIAGILGLVMLGVRKLTAQSRTTETVYAIQKFSIQLKDYLNSFNEANSIFKASAVNDITTKIITAQEFPSELKNSAANIISPYSQISANLNSEFKIYTFSDATHNSASLGLGNYFGVMVTNINYNQCVDLVTQLASTDQLVNQYGIIRVQNKVGTTLPDVVTETDMNQAGSGYVSLSYMLNGTGASGSRFTNYDKQFYTVYNPTGGGGGRGGGGISVPQPCSKSTSLNNLLFAFRLR